MGNLQSVRAWHDGSGFGADWLLQRVLLEHPGAGCRWEAAFNAWIKGGEPNGTTKPAALVQGSAEDAERAHHAAQAAADAKEAERLKVGSSSCSISGSCASSRGRGRGGRGGGRGKAGQGRGGQGGGAGSVWAAWRGNGNRRGRGLGS